MNTCPSVFSNTNPYSQMPLDNTAIIAIPTSSAITPLYSQPSSEDAATKIYAKMLDKYVEKDGIMFSKKVQGFSTGLTFVILKKVFEQIVATHLEHSQSAEMVIEDSGVRYSFIATRDDRRDKYKVHILHELTKAIFNQGTYGLVSTILNLTSAKLAVLKEPVKETTYALKALMCLREEYQNLAKLHDGKPEGIKGIQDLPYCFVEITNSDPKESRIIGMLQKKRYAGGDAFDAFASPGGVLSKISHYSKFRYAIKAALDLSKALAYFATRNFFHGDIKLENILIDITSSDGFVFKFADFADAKFFNSEISLDKQNPFNSKKYLSLADKTKIEEAIANHDMKAFIALQQQRDIAALGITLYSMMRLQWPFPFSEKRPVISQQTLDVAMRPLHSFYSADVCVLLKKMLDPVPEQRISAEQCANEWGVIAQRMNIH